MFHLIIFFSLEFYYLHKLEFYWQNVNVIDIGIHVIGYFDSYVDMGSISSMFYKQLLHTKIQKVPNNCQVFTLFAFLGCSNEKAAWRTMMKLTPRVNFTNIFTQRFYARSSQKRKSQSSRQYLFTLLGSARVKAVRRTLMKLSPSVNFMNILWVPFQMKVLSAAFL